MIEGVLTVTAAKINAVGLVTRPAFTEARVATVAASAQQTSPGSDSLSQVSPISGSAPTAEPGETFSTEPTSTTDPESEPEVSETVIEETVEESLLASAPRPGQRAQLRVTAADVAQRLAAAARAGDHVQLTAALTDVTNTANVYVESPGWLGEVWSGNTFQRQVIPLISTRQLTSYHLKGWRFVAEPVVGTYAGDKGAVPSGAVTTEAVTADAIRLAVAHDVDRKFWDFGDSDFIQSYWQLCAESYAKVTDARATAFLVAQSGTAQVVPTLIDAMVDGAVKIAAAVGAAPTFALCGAAVYKDYLSTTVANAPAQSFGPTPILVPGIPDSEVILGHRNAVTYAELGSSPLRDEALNIPNGGVDVGVFGYYAMYVADAGGLAKFDLSAARSAKASK